MTERTFPGSSGRLSVGLSSASAPAFARGATVSLVLLAAAAGTLFPAPALAQPAATPAAAASRSSNVDQFKDFIFYVKIDNAELAAAIGKELLAKNLSSADFVALVEQSGEYDRFVEAADRAARNPQLDPIAAAMTRLYQTGLLERARNPDQIAQNIKALGGTLRQRLQAQERLVAAGEFAMPQLLEAYLAPGNPTMQTAVRNVIVSMGRQAVMPLSAALLGLSPTQQEQVADLLGLIPHRGSLPYLSDLSDQSKAPAVRAAAQRAMERLGKPDGATPALYYALAESYYAERPETIAFPGEEYQIAWSFDPRIGLVMTPIATPVFHEARAMEVLERAMSIQQGSSTVEADTLALWVASNFSREIDTPAGYVNPAYPVEGSAPEGTTARRSAMYFAVASGAEVAQRVLTRALADRDTPLARLALAAVEKTAGGKSISAEGKMPLLEALTYPNRRVQYEAALALAAANPTEAFPGSDRVVPTLAGAIRGATAQYAVVVAPEPEMYGRIRELLSSLGYTVLPQGRTLSDIAQPIAEAPAVDLVVGVGVRGERASGLIQQVRGGAKTAATPVLILTNTDDYTALNRRYQSDASVAVRQSVVNDDALRNTITGLVESASGGPITAEEAAAYSARSLAALRDLAVANSAVLPVADATLPLLTALTETQGATRLQVAGILSRLSDARAQRAVMDAALAAQGEERTSLLSYTSDSAKRFGNQLEPRQVTRLIALAGEGTDADATAAAALMGALSLPNAQVVPLIMKK